MISPNSKNDSKSPDKENIYLEEEVFTVFSTHRLGITPAYSNRETRITVYTEKGDAISDFGVANHQSMYLNTIQLNKVIKILTFIFNEMTKMDSKDTEKIVEALNPSQHGESEHE